ncbi:MAG: bile acid:sodium symporter [Deltaproteobacteria bacterium]|nr:bile acid:sodium symporter [Deltaproteobacteria bacterium]
MFRINDLILLLVLFLSMLAAIFFPGFGSHFQPYLLYLMMFLLVLSLLSIRIGDVWKILRGSYKSIFLFSLFKIIVLPVILYFLFLYLLPSYAVAALLLTGISTGVTAPFISNIVRANTALVLVMVVLSSIMAPFTLPLLIKILMAQSTNISLLSMIRMLCLVIFIPVLFVEGLRLLFPGLLEKAKGREFPFHLAIVALMNLGVFSKYADYFRHNPVTIVMATLVAIALSCIYMIAGLLFLRKDRMENQIAAAVSMGNMNNVLVIVFSSQFFGPLEPTVAAMYTIPFFGLILPLRYYQRWREKKLACHILN